MPKIEPVDDDELISHMEFLRRVMTLTPSDYVRRQRQVWELIAQQYAKAGGSRENCSENNSANPFTSGQT